MGAAVRDKAVGAVFDRLLDAYGEQFWWPGDSPFEIIVGAVLTQDVAWTNVEKAIHNLKCAGLLTADAILEAEHETLADALRPAGYFNVKAKRLRNLCRFLAQVGGVGVLEQWPTAKLRQALLEVNGVGPETADDILLYAFERPVFVVDAYTRRIGTRLGWLKGGESYEQIRRLFENALGDDVALFNEYHALIVRHAKEACTKRPRCLQCCLVDQCAGRLID